MKKCWKCAEEIQDAAVACRFCSANQASLDRAKLTASNAPARRELPKRSVASIIPGAIIAVGALALIMMFTNTSKSPGVDAAPTIAWQSDLQPTDLAKMLAAFDENEVRAESEYSDHRLTFRGKITNIDAGFGEDANIRIAPDIDSRNGLLIGLIDGQRPLVAQLNKGQDVLVQCENVREILGSAVGSKCLVATP